MNNSGNTHPATSPELCDELRQLRWAYLDTLPGRVADVMLRAADFVEAAMSQPQSPSTSLSDAMSRREWAELIAAQYEVDAVDAIEEGIARGETSIRGALTEAKLLIGAGKGDHPNPAIRESNVNRAWHILHAALAIKSKEQSNGSR